MLISPPSQFMDGIEDMAADGTVARIQTLFAMAVKQQITKVCLALGFR